MIITSVKTDVGLSSGGSIPNSEYKQHQQQSSFTLELKRKGFNLRTGGGRKTLLDGYQLIEEEENPIFKPVEELEFEEEEDF